MHSGKSHKKPLSDRMDTSRAASDPLPGRFEGRERSDAEFLWNQSAGLSPNPEPGAIPSQKETDDALRAVHHRLGWAPKKPGLFTRPQIIWMTAAAMLLLAVGVGYLLTPVTVSTPYGERSEVELADGSRLELNSGTTIRHSRFFGWRNREITLDGEVYITVASAASDEGSPDRRRTQHPFIIRANESVVEVTGTTFNIRSRSDDPGFETRVKVAAGSVSLYPAGHPDRKVQLGAGQSSRWNTTMEAPRAPEPARSDEIAGWRENRFQFRNESLGVIFREIERHFDIRIQLEDGKAASEILTAHYSNPDRPEKIIADICHVKGLRYSRTANGFRIYR